MNIAELLDDLAALPCLDGAACVDHRDLFDAAAARGRTAAARKRAVEVCEGCPALAACRAWLHSIYATSGAARPEVVALWASFGSGRRVVS